MGRLQDRVKVSPSSPVLMVNPTSGNWMYFQGSGQFAVEAVDQQEHAVDTFVSVLPYRASTVPS